MQMTVSTIRRLALALCSLAGVLVLAGAAGGASTAAAAQLSWSASIQVDESGGTPSAIACPSEGLCVAVDSAGMVFHMSNPLAPSSAWSKASKIPSAAHLTAVSCASESLCVAVDDEGQAFASTNPAGSGGTWKSKEIDGSSPLTGISCPSTGLCVAVDREGRAIESTNPGAASPSWTPRSIDSGTALKAVSCPSESLCVAVDAAGRVLASGQPASASSWPVGFFDGLGEPVAISCPSTGLCVAVDSAGDVLASADPGAGNTWSSTPNLTGEPLAVSCASTGLCAFTTRAGSAFAGDDPTAAPPAWTPAGADHTALPDVACLPAGACLALDASGGFVRGLVPAPAVSSPTATEVTPTEATLNGTIDPNGGNLSQCTVLYGPTAAYGPSAPCTTTPTPAAGAQAVHARIAGLAAGTAYHFTLLATNAGGTSVATDATFTTAKAVSVVTPYPSISGVPGVGERMYCNPGVPSNTTATVAYQWVRDTTAIAKATNSSYVIQSADAKHHLQCRVTTTDAAGSVTAGSAFVAVPATGIIAAVGETKIARLTSSGPVLSIPVTCSQQAAGGCTIAIRTTSVQTVRVGKATRRETLTLATGKTHLTRGQRRTIKLTLNATGRRLLAKSHLLHVQVAITGTVIGALQAKLATTALTMRASAAHSSRHTSGHAARRASRPSPGPGR
jgi:hypothetical protein